MGKTRRGKGKGRRGRVNPPVPPRNPAPPVTEETVVTPPRVSPPLPPAIKEPEVSRTKPIEPSKVSEPKDGDFVEDVTLNEIITTDVPKSVDKPIDNVSDATNEILKDSLKENTKPLSPVKPQTTEEEIDDIIKTVEKEVDTAQNISGTDKIDDTDRTSSDDLIDKITDKEQVVTKEVPVDVVKASELEDEKERIRLEKEELKRREIEDERRIERGDALEDEAERRELFDSDILQRKKEFQLLMQEKYPEFSKINTTGKKKPSETELKEIESQRIKDRRKIQQDKEVIRKEKAKLQKRKIERLKNERVRKAEETKFKVNRLRKSEVQTFFEGDVLLEQKEKQERNPDVRGETDVQTKRREVAKFEKQLGRKIVPHRDIVESEESDFDRKAQTEPDDILIIVPKDNKPLKDYNKLNKLVNIRRGLAKRAPAEEDFIKRRKRGSERFREGN
tara:strand:+ start:3067 stop:4413 length:1347 start_codon:yes stop_codon:yes gene_type:complete